MNDLAALHWQRAAFPSPESFRGELVALYARAAPHYDALIPPKQFVADIIKVLVQIYADEFPPGLPDTGRDRHLLKLRDPSAAYRLALQTSLKALVGFTRQFPHRARSDATLPLFTIPYCVLDVAGQNYAAGAYSAFAALSNAFSQESVQLKSCGVFDFQQAPYAWEPFNESEPRFSESEPIYGDQFERRSWRQRKRDFEESEVRYWKQDKKRHEDAHKQAHEHTPSWRQLFLYTPLFFSAPKLPTFTHIPFDIPPERWFEGTWIVGAQGRGKSNLLRHLILHHLKDASIIILDAKGDLLKSFQRMASIKDRLVLIEPDLQYPPALNPLDIGGNAVEFLAYLFELLDTKMTPNQTTLFRLVLTLIQKIPNATLETFRDIIQNGWKPYEHYVRQLKKTDQDFFDKEFNTKTYSERKPEVLLRLRLLLSNPYLEAMFQSPKTRINFTDLMDEGKIVCINNSYNPDKLGEEGSEFFGRVIIALVWAAARRRASRAENRKRPVYFFIDEAHYVIQRDATISKIIQQCRSQKVAMVFAHQEVQQIKNDDVKSALTNCAIKFANSTGEAHELAPRLQTTPEFVKAQRRGTFACYVVDKTDSAVSISVPLVPVRDDQALLDHAYIPDIEYHALMLTMRARYCTGYEPHAPVSDYDLHWQMTVSPRKAEQGGVQREQGYEIRIPAGTVHGAKFRLRGEGTQRPDGGRGDIIISVRVPQQARDGQPAPLAGPSGKEDW